MKKMTTIVTAIFLSLVCAGSARAGEALGVEKVLPLHEARDTYTPCATFVKDTYIVAWQSGRLAPGDLREGYKFSGDIVGCLVGKDGNALDSKPFVICKADDLQERPRAAAAKDVALVVWQDLRNGKDWDVYAARVAPDGKVLDPDGFMVSGGAHNQASPRVAWDGKTFVIVWHDIRNGKKYNVYAARVSAEGKVLDADGIKVSTGHWSSYDPSVASSGNGKSFVFWSCCNFGDFSRGSPPAVGLFLIDGKSSEPTYKGKERTTMGKAQPGGNNTPSFLAAAPSTGSGQGKDAYLMAWRNERPCGRGNGDMNVNAYVFNAQGKWGPKLTLGGQGHRIMSADLVWDGSAFVAAWTEFRVKDDRYYPSYEHVFASRISIAGKLVGAVRLVAGSSTNPKGWHYGRNQMGRAAGKPEPPAMNACVASDGKGTTLIAYEKHPKTGDVPIKIAFRMLKVK